MAAMSQRSQRMIKRIKRTRNTSRRRVGQNLQRAALQAVPEEETKNDGGSQNGLDLAEVN